MTSRELLASIDEAHAWHTMIEATMNPRHDPFPLDVECSCGEAFTLSEQGMKDRKLSRDIIAHAVRTVPEGKA